VGDPVRLVSGLLFPEGPRWYDGALWYAETRGTSMYRLVPGGESELMLTGEEPPSSSGQMPDGSLLVTSLLRRHLLRWSDGNFSLHADLSGIPGDFLNDMVVDETGRAYVGARRFDPTRAYRPAGEGSDRLVMVEPDGTATVVAEGLTATNGVVITPDGTALIVAETYGRRLTRFDRDPASGRLSGRRIFAEFDDITPDGICLDAEGAIWVASPYSEAFVRVHDGGRIDARIPMKGAVACALGGEGRRTLFLVCADPLLLADHSGAPSSPPAGAIYAIEVAVGGAGRP
jgi:sugar lactone lactonase YvrE